MLTWRTVHFISMPINLCLRLHISGMPCCHETQRKFHHDS